MIEYFICVQKSIYDITVGEYYIKLDFNNDNQNHSVLVLLGLICVVDDRGQKTYIPNDYLKKVSMNDYRNKIIENILK